jgi:glycosyltransferase involved in cell wall biosynthesis
MKVVFDCERMKHPNTGIYHYCWHAAKALLPLFKEDGHSLGLYISKNLFGNFGNDVFYLEQKSLNKFYMPYVKGLDIWHVTYQHSNYLPHKNNGRMVLTVHDINFMHDPNKAPHKKKKYLKNLAGHIKRAKAVIFISKFVMDNVRQYLSPAPGQRWEVIYNGCNIEQDIKAVAPATPLAEPFLFTIGTILFKKNFHVLPALLVNNNKKLIIAGIVQDEAYEQRIKEEARKYGVEDRVLFTGAISEEEKYWYLQNCESFVFPSLMEGFGLPVIEAMYFGKPVFLSSFTSLPEIGGDRAYYFNSFEPAAMQQVYREGLQHYHAHPQRPQQIKNRALQFNWSQTAQQYFQLYKDLLPIP